MTAGGPGFRAAIRQVRIAPDERFVAVRTGRRGVVLEDTDEPPRFRTPLSARLINDFDFTVDGHYLITAGHDGTVRIWDPHHGSEEARYDFDVGIAHAITASPDGMTCAVAGEGPHSVVVFDLT